MGDIIRYNQMEVENIAAKIADLSFSLHSISRRINRMNISPEAGGECKIRVSLSSSGHCFSKADGDTVQECVNSYSQAIVACAEYSSKLSQSVSKVSRIFSETERRLSGRENDVYYGNMDDVVIQTSTDTDYISNQNEDKEKEERAEQAKWFKIGITGLAIIGTIAATVATGGAFAAVVAAGAVSGAVVAGANTGADQYIENDWEGIDWRDVGRDAVIGGVVGGVTSAVGYGASSFVTNKLSYATWVQQGIHSTSRITQVTTYAEIGAITNVSSGLVKRPIESMITQQAYYGDIDYNEVFRYTLSPDQIAADGVSGGISGAINGYNQTRPVPEKKPANPGVLDENGNYRWKKGDGSVPGTKKTINLKRGSKVQRYSGPEGTYFAPEGTSYLECALPYDESTVELHHYLIAKDHLKVESSIIDRQQAFEVNNIHNGGGTQYRIPMNGGSGYISAEKAMELGYLVESVESVSFGGRKVSGYDPRDYR